MMKRYEKYKASGVEWIDEIPRHWKMLKIKYFGNVFNGSTPDSGNPDYWNGDIVWITPADISQLSEKYIYTSKKTITKEGLNNCGTNLIPKDSIVLTTRAPIGNVALSGRELCTNQGCKSLVVNSGNPVYQYYQLYSSKELLDAFGSGTTFKELSTDSFKNHFLICPLPEEQTAIARYLDKKTAQIDTLIDKKQKLIELLKEERTAIINHAVTKGFDPNVKLKPSGIKWLSDIPEHWKVKKLKYVTSKVGSGITPTGGASVYQQVGIPLLRSQNIHSDRLVLDDIAYISEEIDEEMSNSRIQEGDVLLNVTGASIGRCHHVPIGFGRGNVNQHVCIIRPIKLEIKTKWLHVIIISAYGQALIDVCQTGANREGLNFQQIKSFDVPLPEIEEQEIIIKHLEIETCKIDTTISKIKKEIDLLQEYRTALISEVVTGKIKVI